MENTTQCPDCATFVAEGADVCPTCGHQFNDESASLPVPPEELDGIIQKWKNASFLNKFFSAKAVINSIKITTIALTTLIVFLMMIMYWADIATGLLNTYKNDILLCKIILITYSTLMAGVSVIEKIKNHYIFKSLGFYISTYNINVKLIIDGALCFNTNKLTEKQQKEFYDNIHLMVRASAYIEKPEAISKNKKLLIVSSIVSVLYYIAILFFFLPAIDNFLTFCATNYNLENAFSSIKNWWIFITSFLSEFVLNTCLIIAFPSETEWIKSNLPNNIETFNKLLGVKKK